MFILPLFLQHSSTLNAHSGHLSGSEGNLAHAIPARETTAIRTPEGVKIAIHLHHVATFRFNISIQTSPCLQPIQVLSVTSLKLSGILKNLKELMCVYLNQIFEFHCIPDFNQTFIQFFPSTFVLKHFSLKKTLIHLVEASLRPKILNDHYLKTIDSRHQYSPVYRN